MVLIKVHQIDQPQLCFQMVNLELKMQQDELLTEFAAFQGIYHWPMVDPLEGSKFSQ